MAIIEVDFTGAPPQQGGGQDYIAPGRYQLKVIKAEPADAASSGRKMVVVNFEIASGEKRGSRITERFVLGQENKRGEKKFHAFMLAIGVVPPARARFDGEMLTGKMVLADIHDRLQAAQGQYPERTVSEVDRYLTAAGVDPSAGPAATPATAPIAAVPAPAPAAPVAPVENGTLPFEPMAEAPVAAAAAAIGQVAAATDAMFE